MTEKVHPAEVADPPPTLLEVFRSLPLTDRLLPLMILITMVTGALIGNYVDAAPVAINRITLSDVSLPMFIGLLVMMYPVLCKVAYETVGSIVRRREFWYRFLFSFVANWVFSPLIMTGLAWATLPDLPGYRNGVILVGIARCIAMVFIWNDLAHGDRDYLALLVALNSVLQIALYAPLAIFYIRVLSPASNHTFELDYWTVCRSVLIFLGAPLVAAILTRLFIIYALRQRAWYERRFLPWISPLSLIGLLFTILVMFIAQGSNIVEQIGSVFRVCVPLLIYFPLVFFGTAFVGLRVFRFDYPQCVAQAFTAASSNFELAIGVAIATFGMDSNEALASVVGPLIEVPVLLCLVYVCLWLRPRFFNPQTDLPWPRQEKSNAILIESDDRKAETQ